MKIILTGTMWTGEKQDQAQDAELLIESIVDEEDCLIRLTINGVEVDFDMAEIVEAVCAHSSLMRTQKIDP